MAHPDSLQEDTAAPVTGDDSDYGSELDEATVNELLLSIDSQGSRSTVNGLTDSFVHASNQEDAVVQDAPSSVQRSLRVQHPRPAGSQDNNDNIIESETRLLIASSVALLGAPLRKPSIEVEYDESNRSTFSPHREKDHSKGASSNGNASPQRAVSLEPPQKDPRSPIERFRTAPKKPLSVTDLISPAWCEQQYWYHLTRYGRVRRTPAMKQGSTVHKTLEEQVHREVKVEVISREDAFALRLWNVIQGLRTLRETGMTREMEVWGIVEGEVVNGIIDQISQVCPDEEMEAKVLEEAEKKEETKKTGGKKGKSAPLGAGQRTLTDYLGAGSQGGSILENSTAWLGSFQEEKRRPFYLIDVKTRQNRSLPPGGTALKSTQMQLMLYHRLLTALASNQVVADQIFSRYNLDPHATFSDTFLAEVTQMDIFNPQTPSPSPEDSSPGRDPLDAVLAHNTLSSLWSHMQAEFAISLPTNPSSPLLSPLLTAEFRAAADGTLIGSRSFAYDSEVLEKYAEDEISWWKGERPTKGVDIEEAFKCRICEFAEGCTWRKEKVEEGVAMMRLRKEKRRSEV